MKQLIFALCLSGLLYFPLAAQEQTKIKDGIVPLSLIFHDIGWNLLHSVTYNNGLNFIAAGLGTWAFIDTGLDWEFRNIFYEHQSIAEAGLPAMYIGYVLPPLAPVATYITGRLLRNERLQITGLALAQGLGITISIQSVFKMTTGRSQPGIIEGHGHTKIDSRDDFSGQFNWFNMNFTDGWPSGHTANAFTAAAIIGEIYHDKPLLVVGMYTYAVFVAASMSVSVHWISEVFAGALIGYAVGKTVGRSYRNLMGDRAEEKKLSVYALPQGIGMSIRW